MASTVAIQRKTLATATSPQDITVTGFGTPDACILIVGLDAADGTIDTHASTYTVIYDGTTQKGLGCVEDDGQGTAEAWTYFKDGILFYAPNGAKVMEGTLSFITDGVRLTFTTNPTLQCRVLAILFKGVSAKVDVKWSNGTVGNSNTETVNFETDFLYTLSTINDIVSSAGPTKEDGLNVAFGMATKEGSSVPQCCVSYASEFGADTTALDQIFSDSYICSYLPTCGTLDTLEIHNITATTFQVKSVAKYSGVDNCAYAYLAIGLTDLGQELEIWDVTTGTGNKTVSGMSIQPDVNLQIQSGCNLADTEYTSGEDAGCFGFGIFDDTSEWACGYGSEDNVGTSECNSINDGKVTTLLDSTDPGATKLHVGNLVSINSDGFTVNITTNNASNTKKYGTVGFGNAPAASRVPDLMPVM